MYSALGPEGMAAGGGGAGGVGACATALTGVTGAGSAADSLGAATTGRGAGVGSVGKDGADLILTGVGVAFAGTGGGGGAGVGVGADSIEIASGIRCGGAGCATAHATTAAIATDSSENAAPNACQRRFACPLVGCVHTAAFTVRSPWPPGRSAWRHPSARRRWRP